MSLDSWDWFIELAETKNFTKAADRLQISQQTLSARLATLEKSLDAKLIVRGNPVALTRAGLVFLTYAREQQQSRADMLTQIGEVTGGVSGVIKIGISHMRGRALMPRIMKRLHQLYPNVSMHLIEGTNKELIRMAEHAEVDAVIASIDDSHPSVCVTPLYQEEVVLVMHPNLLERVMGMTASDAIDVLTDDGIDALADCPFLLETVDDIMGRIAYSELRNAGIKPHTLATSENLPTLLAMCAEGLGAVFCSQNMLNTTPRLSEGLVRIPLSPKAKCTISLGVPAQTDRWTAIDAFTDLLLEEAHDQ